MENNCNIKNRKQPDSGDILENPHLKANPFTLPQGYFSQMEARLQETIHHPEKKTESPALSSLRTSFAMVAMFALVFGLAYGVFSITGTSNLSSPDQTNVAENGPLPKITPEEGKELISDEELLQYYGNYDTYSAETLATINVVPPAVNKDEIEQYLIDSNVPSFMVLAALE